jgi:chromosomal replication initiator protein
MELTAGEAWARILERARPLLPEQNFRLWLVQTAPVSLSHDTLEVAAGSAFAVEFIEKKYGELLTEVAERVLGRPLTITFHHVEERQVAGASRSVPVPGMHAARSAPTDGGPGMPRPGDRAFHSGASVDAVDSPPRSPEGMTPAGPTRAGGNAGTPPRPRPPAVTIGSALNDRYTFDRFVVGTNNQLAAAACRAVSEAPARMYNPLFVYGGVGLGKTHLMHAIGHAMTEREPDRRVAYVSSERFTNDLITSIQEGRMADFRRRYRGVDLLLIDDVQFLGEKERTQEEFFHTFNALHDDNAQIVMTSDRPPKEIPGLEERLVSRFEWGLVTDIKAPDLETRVAILRKKSEDDQIPLSDDVFNFVARNCRSNVRELEGAIIKLLAYASLTRREISTELAREALGGVLDTNHALPLSPEAIRQRVAHEWGVSVDGLTSKKRTKELTVPRQVAMFLIRELVDMPLVEIGKLFGGRDHSTVIHSINKVEDEVNVDPPLRARIDAIRASFGR